MPALYVPLTAAVPTSAATPTAVEATLTTAPVTVQPLSPHTSSIPATALRIVPIPLVLICGYNTSLRTVFRGDHMTHEKLVRVTLLLSVPFNFIAAWGMLLPSSFVGRLMQLPTEVPITYAALLSYLVLIFGCAYGWLALSTVINQALLMVGVIGKAGVFFILLTLWLLALGPGVPVFVASGDLAFAIIWGSWVFTQRQPS